MRATLLHSWCFWCRRTQKWEKKNTKLTKKKTSNHAFINWTEQSRWRIWKLIAARQRQYNHHYLGTSKYVLKQRSVHRWDHSVRDTFVVHLTAKIVRINDRPKCSSFIRKLYSSSQNIYVLFGWSCANCHWWTPLGMLSHPTYSMRIDGAQHAQTRIIRGKPVADYYLLSLIHVNLNRGKNSHNTKCIFFFSSNLQFDT